MFRFAIFEDGDVPGAAEGSQAAVEAAQFPQAALGAAQDERQPVFVGLALQLHACFAKEVIELVDSI